MKTTTRLAHFAFCAIFLPLTLEAQINVVSSNGYVVNVAAIPTAVLPSTTNCTWGYNYNLQVSYIVTFTGSNIPPSLYTLQGTIRCGSSNHFFDLPNNGGVGSINSTSNVWNGAQTCNTATVFSLACNTARIQIGGPGIPAQTVTFPITYTLLPVNIVEFSAAPTESGVSLKWKTASEANSHYFAIERSADAVNWTELGRTDAAGSSSGMRSYNWIDDHPLPGLSYYRLNMVDIDGRSAYSESRSVRFKKGARPLSVFPVPNPGNTITISGISDFRHYSLRVTNGLGHTEFQTETVLEKMELPPLAKGLYLLTFSNRLSGATQTVKYVKL